MIRDFPRGDGKNGKRLSLQAEIVTLLPFPGSPLALDLADLATILAWSILTEY